ncbi:MAG: iron chelate uptake ABC transporter family permease subunit [Gemmatimonadales bacterium]|jgi:zinc/manganese transport system permease protein
MSELLQLMIAPFVASMLLVAMLSYLGVHIIARGVIFVDLALAQMAALGVTFGLLFHVSPDAPLSYGFALGFTTLGAALFAITREHSEERRVPQEAIIGIVYIVATAAALLIADRTPAGGEAVKDVLVGSLLWVSWPTIGRIAVVYAVVGVIQWLLRDRFLTVSLREDEAEEKGWRIRWWDFLFYGLFGVVITLAVPLAGILLVFTLLVVPAVVAFQFTRSTGALIAISWAVSALAVVAGLATSFHFDLPTGPLMVCTFGLLLLVAFVLRRAMGRPA